MGVETTKIFRRVSSSYESVCDEESEGRTLHPTSQDEEGRSEGGRDLFTSGFIVEREKSISAQIFRVVVVRRFTEGSGYLRKVPEGLLNTSRNETKEDYSTI